MSDFSGLLRVLFSEDITYALSAIARLGAPDHMSQDPGPLTEIALAVGADEENPERRFGLTSISDLLRSDAAGSMRHLAIQVGDAWSTRALEHFTAVICTVQNGINKAFGEDLFDYFRHEPEEVQTFHQSMSGLSAAMSEAIVKANNFSDINRLAEIGGGHGFL